MQLPYSNKLPIDKLSQCFNNTTNSYKFYWFLAILDELIRGKSRILNMEDLAIQMLTQVWYPLDFYKLSFGKQDSFKRIAKTITSKVDINNASNNKGLIQQIENNLEANEINQINKEVLILLNDVPHRFIRPFFKEQVKNQDGNALKKSIYYLANKSFERKTHQSIYRFAVGKKIEIDNIWAEYFNKNQQIIRGFIYWHLLKFLQKHNPNVIGLSEKLFKPSKRNFNTAKKFWKSYFTANKSVRCIYSNKIIHTTVSIDHFLPWSYVVHDELWNLLPTLNHINSKKNNQLPKLSRYLGSFLDLQYKAFHSYILHNDKYVNALEGYTKLFNLSLEEIQKLPQQQFEQKIKDTITPMHQIAQNMGFATNWTYQP